MTEPEQLFKNIFQIQLAAPAKTLGERDRYSVAIVDVAKV